MPSTNNQTGKKASNGTIWMNNGFSGVSFSITTSYTELRALSTSFTLFSPANDFEMSSDGRLKYTGIKTKNFIIEGYVAQSSASSVALAIYKNGSLVTGGESYEVSSEVMAVLAPVTLATNDYVSLFIKRSTGTTITIYQVTLGVASDIGA